MKRQHLLIAGALVAVGFGWISSLVHVVMDDEMAPALHIGDRLWTVDRPPEVGEVVQLPDPLDPERTVMRRVLAGPGATVSFLGDVANIDGQSLEHIEMFRDKNVLVLRERNAYQIQREPGATRADVSPQTVPEGHVFLAADNRSLGVDSRWWGPVPISQIAGVAVWRVGAATAWQARTGKP